MDHRPWWERLFDRDNPAGPIIVLVLLGLAIAAVLTIGPLLDRMIEGPAPASHIAEPSAPLLLLPRAGAVEPLRLSSAVLLARLGAVEGYGTKGYPGL